MAISVVQSVTAEVINGVTAGNFLVLQEAVGSSAFITDVSDSTSDTWYKIFEVAGEGGITYNAWGCKAATGGTHTLTVTRGGSNQSRRLIEFAPGGSDTFAAEPVGTNEVGRLFLDVDTQSPTATSLSINHGGEWLALAGFVYSTGFSVTTPPSGYTSLATDSRMATYYKTGSGAASENATAVTAATERGAAAMIVLGVDFTPPPSGSPARVFWWVRP